MLQKGTLVDFAEKARPRVGPSRIKSRFFVTAKRVSQAAHAVSQRHRGVDSLDNDTILFLITVSYGSFGLPIDATRLRRSARLKGTMETTASIVYSKNYRSLQTSPKASLTPRHRTCSVKNISFPFLLMSGRRPRAIFREYTCLAPLLLAATRLRPSS